MGDFVHLHLHSEYSLLDGACRISAIPERAAECGHKAVALTDHGVMYGVIPFYEACRRVGIKPVIGCEVYVAPGSRFEKSGNSATRSGFHLVLLCKDAVGYRNLMFLVSKGFTEGFYSKPRIDRDLLAGHAEGLIGLSACLAGQIPQLLLAGNFEEARQVARQYAGLFAPGDFYLEVQNHGLAEQKQILPSLIRLAREEKLPLVATNDCHYLRRSDADDQAVLLCIQTNTCIQDGRPIGFETDEFYYKTTAEMEALFGNICPEALENTCQIADKCNLELDFSAVHLPHYPCPDGMSSADYLRQLAEEGFARRRETGMLGYGASGRQHTEAEYRERMEYELSVIDGMGYADYFLIVADYVNFAKSRAIPVGPGRGSGAGSLVAFFLGITEVDSIAFDLLFERFLNPERVSMPDIDMDFCYNRRDEVIRYVIQKYGADHVSQIVTFGTLAARAAIRDVGRALGMSFAAVDPVARAVPQELDMTLDKALKLPALREQYESSPETQRLVDIARALEGMPRNMSVHAAGILITERPLYDFVPLAVSNETVVCQYDMDTLSHLGLLKFDFLALRYLTICNDAQLQIREQNPAFDLDRVSLSDPETFRLIASGDTAGVFQLESAGMRQMLTELSPAALEDIQAAIALYRPGPMDSIPRYIENRKNPAGIQYADPRLVPILASTYGCIVYQEQVMSIFRVLAGYSFGHADIVRRAMAKKKADVLEAERESFLSGAEANGMERETANRLFDSMADFANYAFNRAHAASYALISYRTAYLKAHYPREYLAALLTSVLGNIPKTGEYIAECQHRGISVFPPNINESFATFHADRARSGIHFGLGALKNVGRAFIDTVVAERESGGAFTSLDNFIHRLSGHDLNRRQVEALLKAGAFDGLGGISRRAMLLSYDRLIDLEAEKGRRNLEGQMDMFSLLGDTNRTEAVSGFTYPEVEEFSPRDKLMQEKEASGMYFSGHLLDSYSRQLATLHTTEIAALLDTDENGDYRTPEKTRLTVCGICNSVTLKFTRKEERMAFFTLEDRYAEIECLAFPKVFTAVGERIVPDAGLLVSGTVSYRENEDPKLLVDTVDLLCDNEHFTGNRTDAPTPTDKPLPEKTGTPVSKPAPPHLTLRKDGKLYLRLPDENCRAWRKAENLLEIFPGAVPVVFFNRKTGEYRVWRGGVALTDYLFAEFAAIAGEENAVYR